MFIFYSYSNNIKLASFLFFFFFQLSNTRIFQRSFRSSRELYGKKKKEKCFKSKDSRFSIQNLIFSIVNLRYILLQSERLISLIHNPLTPECLFENSSISKKNRTFSESNDLPRLDTILSPIHEKKTNDKKERSHFHHTYTDRNHRLAKPSWKIFWVISSPRIAA